MYCIDLGVSIQTTLRFSIQTVFRCLYNYNCLIIFSFFSFFSFLFLVPASVNQIDNETVVEGDSVSLNCNAMGSPTPVVAWSKIGGGVVSQDRWLNITNITKADRGQYQCFANNTCGSDVTFTSINVQCKILK